MAVREPDRLFVNGVDLGKHWFLTVESTYQMPAQVRDGLVETPGRHGARGSGRPPLYDVGAGKLVLHVGEPQRGHLRDVLDELIGLLTGGSEVVLRHASGGQAREAVIAVQSWNVTERVPQVFADLEVSYVVPGVFLRSLTTRERTIPPGSSVLPREGTAPITDAIVRFAGPSYGSHTVTEGVWGTGITVGGSLVSGQYVFVDPRAMRAWQGASGDWHRPSTVKDVSTRLSPETAGPLSLHHTTGWGQGAVTATNESTDPQVLQSMSALNDSRVEFISGGGARWFRNDDATNPQPYLSLGASAAFSVDFTNTSGLPLVARTYVWRSAGSDYTYTDVAPGATVRVGQRSRDGGSGTTILLVAFQHGGQLPDAGAEIGVVTRRRLGDSAAPAGVPAPFFDGDTPDTDDLVYEWTGTPGQSASTVGPRALVRSTPITASKAATIRYREAWL